MVVDVAKQIWDTLHFAHEGVDKVRKARMELLMAKLDRFMILDGEGLQEMFDRLMVIVGKIRGYGGDELDDYKVVKIMLEAYSPRNETVVTLIRDKKMFEYFIPNDVLGRILTLDMQREEANERKKLGELQAKLDGMKIKDVALKANKLSKQSSTSKSKINKQASTSKPKQSSSPRIKDNKYKKHKKEDKDDHRKNTKYMGEAHIGHEWDSTRGSTSQEDEKIATVAIHKSSPTPRLFNNMFDDDYYFPHICLMAKDEKEGQNQYRSTCTACGSAMMKGGCVTPRKNKKATNSVPDQAKPIKKVFQQKHVSEKSNNQCGAIRTNVTFDESNGSQVEQVDSSVVGREDPPCEAMKQLAIGDIRPQEDQAIEVDVPQVAAAPISADIPDAEQKQTPATTPERGSAMPKGGSATPT
ncbi:uncharacterized protein [Miscanthus floridulus]|uniref:uncharacterized protein n=1 Tax=Miscanthus floridulus TaxID=154761 RepID=UPI00345A2994